MKIYYQKYTFTIEALDILYLPYYKGSTFRGGFGNLFRKIVCPLKKMECLSCPIMLKCIYAYIFETPSKEDAEIMNMHKYEKVPHPFVLEPPLEENEFSLSSEIQQNQNKLIQPGSKIDFNLILIGKATDYLPYFIYTFEELGKIGIGKKRGRYRLKEVKLSVDKTNSHKITVYNGVEKVLRHGAISEIHIPENFKATGKLSELTIQFQTPLRIKYNRELVVRPEFHILIRNLLRRIGLLYYFHCGGKRPTWDFRAIIEHAQRVEIKDSKLKWFDWERYSTRQNTRMKLGGLIGQTTYTGDIEQFLPILKTGEILHAGKNTTFGLGKYKIKIDI